MYNQTPKQSASEVMRSFLAAAGGPAKRQTTNLSKVLTRALAAPATT